MGNKSAVIAFKNGELIQKVWSNVRDCCKDNNLSYWSIVRKKSPIEYKEFKIVKLDF